MLKLTKVVQSRYFSDLPEGSLFKYTHDNKCLYQKIKEILIDGINMNAFKFTFNESGTYMILTQIAMYAQIEAINVTHVEMTYTSI